MITYQVSRMICPQCNHKLGRGFRRFGPPMVRCGHCGATLRTGLEGWHDPFPFPGRGRAMIALAELLSPSWTGLRGFRGGFLHCFIIAPLIFAVTGLVGGIPFFILMAASSALMPAARGGTGGQVLGGIGAVLILGGMLVGILLWTAGTLAYPAFLVVRLVRMVRESAAYRRTGVPPVWK